MVFLEDMERAERIINEADLDVSHDEQTDDSNEGGEEIDDTNEGESTSTIERHCVLCNRPGRLMCNQCIMSLGTKKTTQATETNEEKEPPQRRRSTRESKGKPPLRMGVHDESHLMKVLMLSAKQDNRLDNQLREIALNAIGSCPIPKSWREAKSSPEWPQWEEAAQKEMENMQKHDVWEEVMPKGDERIMNVILRFEKKFDANGKLRKFKVRLCADGRSQEAGIDFDKTFAPTIPAAVMRMMLAIMVECDMQAIQFDVSGAFLNSLQDKRLFIRCPPGFKRKMRGSILRLKKALHGQKQSAMLWHETLKKILENMGFTELRTARSMFIRRRGNHTDFMLIHVDVRGGGPCHEAKHETIREGPRLRGVVTAQVNANTALLKELTSHSLLGSLSVLHKPSQGRVETQGPGCLASQKHAIRCGINGQHDDHGVGSRKAGEAALISPRPILVPVSASRPGQRVGSAAAEFRPLVPAPGAQG